VKIPFRTITPVNGTVIGFDVQINDGKDGARQSVATWNDLTGNAYQDTSVIGNLLLVGKSAEEATRGEAIVLIMKAYGIEPLVDTKDNFSDAQGENAGYYTKAKAIGLTKGIGNNRLGADLPMTREMLYTMVYNMEVQEGKLQKPDASAKDLSSFSDHEELSDWSVKAVKALVEAGIIQGDKLNPKGIVTVDEIQQLLESLK
jgi:endo-1,4-beta-xylanase